MTNRNLKHLVAAFVVAMGALNLTACGFALRGTSDHALTLAPQHTQAAVTLEDTPIAVALKSPLLRQLQLIGVHNQTNSPNRIDIKNVRFRRFELVGTLTEVRQVLTADISYTVIKNGQTFHFSGPLQVESTHQYDEVSVVTGDKQGDKAQTWLYETLAQRIAEQYRTHALTD